MIQLPKLPYSYSELEPWIDAKTMEIHHTKHHQAYIDKLNAALEKYPEMFDIDTRDLLKKLNSLPDSIKTVVRNHGGGHVNHTFFWRLLRKGRENNVPHGKILAEINKKFGSFEEFKKLFKEQAMNRFGSGWAWLVLNHHELELVSTGNQDSPLTDGKIPLLGIDVWEHAYYLKYQNKRAEYVDAFFYVINWDEVEKNFLNA